MQTNDNLVVSASTGCLEVCTAIYPHTSWDCSWISYDLKTHQQQWLVLETMNKALKQRKNQC